MKQVSKSASPKTLETIIHIFKKQVKQISIMSR